VAVLKVMICTDIHDADIQSLIELHPASFRILIATYGIDLNAQEEVLLVRL